MSSTSDSNPTRDSSDSGAVTTQTGVDFDVIDGGVQSFGKRGYRFLKRKRAAPKPLSKLLEKRLSSEGVCNDLTHANNDGSRVITNCCSNQCLGQLLGSDSGLFTACPSTEEATQRHAFVEAVIETRRAIHSEGEIKSGECLTNRLRSGFSAGLTQLSFASEYSFPDQRLQASQEYWWRTEGGSCVQVSTPRNP